MGLLDALFGTTSTAAAVDKTTATKDSYAVLLIDVLEFAQVYWHITKEGGYLLNCSD